MHIVHLFVNWGSFPPSFYAPPMEPDTFIEDFSRYSPAELRPFFIAAVGYLAQHRIKTKKEIAEKLGMNSSALTRLIDPGKYVLSEPAGQQLRIDLEKLLEMNHLGILQNGIVAERQGSDFPEKKAVYDDSIYYIYFYWLQDLNKLGQLVLRFYNNYKNAELKFYSSADFSPYSNAPHTAPVQMTDGNLFIHLKDSQTQQHGSTLVVKADPHSLREAPMLLGTFAGVNLLTKSPICGQFVLYRLDDCKTLQDVENMLPTCQTLPYIDLVHKNLYQCWLGYPGGLVLTPSHLASYKSPYLPTPQQP